MDELRFHCVICGASLEVPRGFAARVTECPHCLRYVPIPAAVSFPHQEVDCPPILPRGILSLEIKILCPSCDSKLRLDARLEGSEIACPVCERRFLVPTWSRQPADSIAVPSLSVAEVEFLSALAEPVPEKERAS